MNNITWFQKSFNHFVNIYQFSARITFWDLCDLILHWIHQLKLFVMFALPPNGSAFLYLTSCLYCWNFSFWLVFILAPVSLICLSPSHPNIGGTQAQVSDIQPHLKLTTSNGVFKVEFSCIWDFQKQQDTKDTGIKICKSSKKRQMSLFPQVIRILCISILPRLAISQTYHGLRQRLAFFLCVWSFYCHQLHSTDFSATTHLRFFLLLLNNFA